MYCCISGNVLKIYYIPTIAFFNSVIRKIKKLSKHLFTAPLHRFYAVGEIEAQLAQVTASASKTEAFLCLKGTYPIKK